MKAFVCVLTSRDNIIETVLRQKERLIPEHLLKTKNNSEAPVKVKIAVFNPKRETISFEKYLLREAMCCDAAILLVENPHTHLINSVANAVFAATFEITDDRINNFKNFFGSFFSPLFKNFFIIKKCMSNTEREQAMMLPLRNFDSPELQELARLIKEDSKSPNFVLSIEAQLAEVMKLRSPRSKTSRKTKYFIDDQRKHFEYGKENHARFDTAAPHTAACEINGNFRFGKKIDSLRHYNVSCGDGDVTTIAGKFPDCHGQIKSVTEQTHLNMFSNDFF